MCSINILYLLQEVPEGDMKNWLSQNSSGLAEGGGDIGARLKVSYLPLSPWSSGSF